MKKGLFVLVVVALVFGSVMPVLAQGVDTSAVVQAGNNGDPLVVAAWWGVPNRDNDPSSPGLQLVPNAGSSTGLGKTEICLWMVIWDPYGPSNVTGAPVDVYEPTTPCGSESQFKVQIHAAPDGPCGDNGLGTSRFRAAIDGGLVWFNPDAVGTVPGVSTVEDAYTQVHNCGLYVWVACFEYDNHQFPGCYWAQIRPTNATGGQGLAVIPPCYLYIEEIFAFAKDFTSVNWGPIARGVEKWVMGNTNWGDNIPTLHNQGNVDVIVETLFTRMYQQGEGLPSPKYIDHFDARFQNVDYDPIAASTAYLPTSNPATWTPSDNDPRWYPLDDGNVLIPCTPTKIDFSIHPPADLLAGTYEGLLFLRAVDANPLDCNGGTCPR